MQENQSFGMSLPFISTTQNTEKLSLNYLVAYAQNMGFVQYVSICVC